MKIYRSKIYRYKKERYIKNVVYHNCKCSRWELTYLRSFLMVKLIVLRNDPPNEDDDGELFVILCRRVG